MQQLSNASSPAESVVSTSSNPGHSLGSSGASSRSVELGVSIKKTVNDWKCKSRNICRTGKREKRGRGKKGRPGSKNGSSRGSTPPLMEWTCLWFYQNLTTLYIYRSLSVVFISCYSFIAYVTLMRMWCQHAHRCIVPTCEHKTMIKVCISDCYGSKL